MTRRLLLLPTLILLLAACGGGTVERTTAPDGTPDGTDAPDATATPPSAEGEETSVFDLALGACFDIEEAEFVEVVEQIDCAAAHAYELYAVIDHPAGSDEDYPGTDEMAEFTAAECVEAFEEFVGSDYATSELYIFDLTPTETSWTFGDREVLCALHLEEGTLTGSMEGSGR